jgi:hypothetical protein
MEIAHVRVEGATLRAVGTQIGATYELRYELNPGVLSLEVVERRRLTLTLGEADFFDLGLSPLFNSLPVLRDNLLQTQGHRDYSMLWVSVPELTVERSQQTYTPLGANRIRFSAGSFSTEVLFDDEGFVVDYPGLAFRVT